MTYANARASGDGSLISRYVSRGPCLSPYKANRIGQYGVLTSWADYLVNTPLFIHDQYVVFINTLSNADIGQWYRSSAGGLSVSNQTNLAIKGIIGIQAMSKMCSILDQVTEAKNYSVRTIFFSYYTVGLTRLQTAAAQLYGQWKGVALGNDQHLLAVYEQPASWTLGYNLFADIWLGTELIESSVGMDVLFFRPTLIILQIYDNQSSFINNLLLDTEISNFGLPVDNLSSSTSITVSS